MPPTTLRTVAREVIYAGGASEMSFLESDDTRLSARSTLPRTHLDTWAGLQARQTNSPPAGGRADAGEPRSPKTRAPQTLSTRSTSTRTYMDTWTQPTEDGRPRREPPGDDKYMPTSYIWDSGQEITGGTGGRRRRRTVFRLLTGAVGGGGASCRRGRRKGKGIGASTETGGGVRLLPQ